MGHGAVPQHIAPGTPPAQMMRRSPSGQITRDSPVHLSHSASGMERLHLSGILPMTSV